MLAMEGGATSAAAGSSESIPMVESCSINDDTAAHPGLSSSDNAADSRYCFDEHKLAELRSDSPWTTETKYFSSVAISPSAIMKMMMHCQSGVNKGVQKGGNPIEVMGMLLGRPDPDTPHTLVVTDAFPLPIEGFETRVVADDVNVVNHMISLGECLELTRHEKFMGWYHSHPFDLGPNSHCFLSQTDLSTQLQWQRAEDPHGNPFVALVVDPLRSIHRGIPEIKAFRAYPPEYISPITNECPDGSIVAEEQTRLELWGSCWNRYYELNVEYFMSSHARKVLEQLTRDYLWIRALSQSDFEAESLAEKLKTASLPLLEKPVAMSGAGSTGSGTSSTSLGAASNQASGSESLPTEMGEVVDRVVELASQQLYSTTLSNVKKQVFAKGN